MNKFSIENRKILIDGIESGTSFTLELEECITCGNHDTNMLVNAVDAIIDDVCERIDLSFMETVKGKIILLKHFRGMM